MEDKSGSLLLLAGSIPLFTKEQIEITKPEHEHKDMMNGGVKRGGGDNIENELRTGSGNEVTDAAKLLLFCHNNGVVAKGRPDEMVNHNQDNTNANYDKSMEKGEEEIEELSIEMYCGDDTMSIKNSMNDSIPVPGHVSPKLEEPQGRGGSNSPQRMLDSLADLAAKELMDMESNHQDSSRCKNSSNDMEYSSNIEGRLGSVLVSLKNDVGNGFTNEDYKLKEFNSAGMVTRQHRSTQRPRSVSDPEGVNEWGRGRVVNKFDTIKEESYEGEMEDTTQAVSLVPPHTLDKYASTYNRDGRIGIYTSKEREAILSRFKAKRERRVWRKKIRYSCRRSLAEKRARIKGRFVKLSGSDPTQGAPKSGSRPRSISFASQTSEDTSYSPTHDPEKWEECDEAETYHRVRRHSIA